MLSIFEYTMFIASIKLFSTNSFPLHLKFGLLIHKILRTVQNKNFHESPKLLVETSTPIINLKFNCDNSQLFENDFINNVTRIKGIIYICITILICNVYLQTINTYCFCHSYVLSQQIKHFNFTVCTQFFIVY